MMPLSYATPGEENVIRRIGGSVKVITAMNGNVIVKVKEARVAINDEMARRIMI